MTTSAGTLISHATTIIAVLSTVLWADAVVAGPLPESTVIQYRDLDLATEAGVQALYARIQAAAHHVCFLETTSHPGIDQRERYFACYEDAVASAVKQLGQARLAALHRAHSRLAVN